MDVQKRSNVVLVNLKSFNSKFSFYKYLKKIGQDNVINDLKKSKFKEPTNVIGQDRFQKINAQKASPEKKLVVGSEEIPSEDDPRFEDI